ncbi:Histidine N-alpha-methyltransferase [Thalassocella blandensis]|nr:Histidine N-alpha-methyltransferase [Thalassocella blandensis]
MSNIALPIQGATTSPIDTHAVQQHSIPKTNVQEKTPVIERNQFYYDVLAGLNASQKHLSPKYFYDESGSHYFDQICALDEYYPYKTELTLLPEVASTLAKNLQGQFALVEFGAGSLLKVKPLLNEIDGIHRFMPIDISGEHLVSACEQLQQEYQSLEVAPTVADFTQPLALDGFHGLQPLGFFPGSTIGNFTPDEAAGFLQNVRNILGPDSYLLIGVDTKKSPRTLHRAYNDQMGITAKFNLNILHRINRHFDSRLDVADFEHYAFYNTSEGRIEMHLVSRKAHNIVLDETIIHFDEGESIHTESSYKYSPQDFQTLAAKTGWQIDQAWMAQGDMFSMYLLKNAVH